MDRRAYLGLGAGLAAGLAGCTANALPSPDLMDKSTPEPACPAIDGLERSICPADDAPISVNRSSKTVSGESWSLVVGLINQSEQALALTPAGWSLFKRSQDGWTALVPAAQVQESRTLAPGDGYGWQLTAGAEALSDPDRRVYLDLAPGHYAFLVPVGTDPRYGAVAPFEMLG